MRSAVRVILMLAALLAGAAPALRADDGYGLWLRYRPVSDAARLAEYRAALSQLVVEGDSPTLRAARDELARGLSGLLGREVAAGRRAGGDGAVIVGTPASSPLIAALPLARELRRAGEEGYVVRATTVGGRRAVVVAANRDAGALYGAFALLRHLQTHGSLRGLALADAPRIRRRVLNHWDNLDRTVERGYAGFSLWDWHKLPDYLRSPLHATTRAPTRRWASTAPCSPTSTPTPWCSPPSTWPRSPRWRACSGPTGSACISPRASAPPSRSAG